MALQPGKGPRRFTEVSPARDKTAFPKCYSNDSFPNIHQRPAGPDSGFLPQESILQCDPLILRKSEKEE